MKINSMTVLRIMPVDGFAFSNTCTISFGINEDDAVNPREQIRLDIIYDSLSSPTLLFGVLSFRRNMDKDVDKKAGIFIEDYDLYRDKRGISFKMVDMDVLFTLEPRIAPPPMEEGF